MMRRSLAQWLLALVAWLDPEMPVVLRWHGTIEVNASGVHFEDTVAKSRRIPLVFIGPSVFAYAGAYCAYSMVEDFLHACATLWVPAP